MQYPIEVPGVSLTDALIESFRAAGRDVAEVPALLAAEAERIGFDARFIDRPLNVDLSGGERKRNETMQLGVLQPKIAVLDELDSGLDVDALRDVARRIEAATHEDDLGVLAITHYSRLLARTASRRRPRAVAGGRIVGHRRSRTGADLEDTGYAGYAEEATTAGGRRRRRPLRRSARSDGLGVRVVAWSTMAWTTAGTTPPRGRGRRSAPVVVVAGPLAGGVPSGAASLNGTAACEPPIT